jgi:uncharacterized membrane protein (TIGR02234 family)
VTSPAAAPTRGRRLYAPSVLGLLVAGGVAWVALGRTWASTRLAPQGLPPADVVVTGRDVAPLAAALAVVVVTAALAVLATRGRGRWVVGVLVVLLGVGGAVLSVLGGTGDGSRDALVGAAEQSPAFTGEDLGRVATSPWPFVAAGGFVVAALLGALVVRHGRGWPGMSGRYDAPSRRPVVEDPWKALDEGRDPTV